MHRRSQKPAYSFAAVSANDARAANDNFFGLVSSDGFDLIPAFAGTNLTSRADANESVSEVYCYDLLNRLVNSATGTGGASVATCTSSGTGIIDKTIGFDALGDIASKSDVGTYTYGSGAGPHAVTSITGSVNGVTNPSFAYDANGNMTSGAGRTLTYTSYNLTSTFAYGSVSLGFTYDSEHSRIIQTSTATGTTVYLNDPVSGAMEEHVVNGSSTVWNDYVRMPEGETGGRATNTDSDPSTPLFAAVPDVGNLIALRTTTPTVGAAIWGAFNWGAANWSASSATVAVDYYSLDHLGTIAVVANATGGVTERDSYDAWGRRRNTSGTDISGCAFPASVTTKGFTSQEMMDSVCTINLNARVYDPTIARFMAADPVTQSEYNLQTLNRYSYVDNGPLSHVDPTGRDTWGFGVAYSINLGGVVTWKGSFGVDLDAQGGATLRLSGGLQGGLNVKQYFSNLKNALLTPGNWGNLKSAAFSESIQIEETQSNANSVNSLKDRFNEQTTEGGLGLGVSQTKFTGTDESGAKITGSTYGVGEIVGGSYSEGQSTSQLIAPTIVGTPDGSSGSSSSSSRSSSPKPTASKSSGDTSPPSLNSTASPYGCMDNVMSGGSCSK